MTASIATFMFFSGASPYLPVALASAAATFLLVLLTTAAIVIVKRRGDRAPVRVGRKGFMDYKMQGQRALGRMSKSLGAITRLIEVVGAEATAGARRTTRAQTGWFSSDESAYLAIERTAARLDKRALAMKLHATQYGADVRLFVEGFGKWAVWIRDQGPANQPQREQLAQMFNGMRTVAAAQIPSLRQFCDTIEGTRVASEHMDIAGQSLTEAVTTVVDSTQEVITFCDEQISALRG